MAKKGSLGIKVNLDNIEFGQNFVSKLKEEDLKVLGEDATIAFDNDKQSRAEWEVRYAKWLKLFATMKDTKTFPWPNCSNIALPTLSTCAIQFQARAFEALIPSKDIIKVIPTGVEDTPKAVRTAKYGNWYLTNKMIEFMEGVDQALMAESILGCFFKKTWYDAVRKRVISDYVPAADVVVNYSVRRLEDAARISHVIRLTQEDFDDRVAREIYQNAEALKGVVVDAHYLDGDIEAQKDENQGITSGNYDSYRVVVEQHRKYDFNGDGIYEPYIITFDHATSTVLSIVQAENARTGVPLSFFVKYDFLPNPDGFYGIGFGALLEGTVEGMDAILNQLIDSGTLANTQGGFITDSVRFLGENKTQVRYEMGKFSKVNIMGGNDIKGAIMPLPFKEPSSTLFALLGSLQNYVNRLTTVTEVQTGEMPRSDTTTGGIAAMVDQGMKVFSSIHKRNHRSLKRELANIFAMIDLTLDLKEYMDVLGPLDMGQATPDEIATDFANAIDIIPVSDPQIISKSEKIALAQNVLGVIGKHPSTARNKKAQDEALKDYLTALGVDAPQRFLEPPKEEQQPPQDVPSEIENVTVLTMKGPIKALMPQNHLEHIKNHEEFIEITGKNMTKEAKTAMEAHIREHIAMDYMRRKNVGSGSGQQGMGQMGQRPVGAMGQRPNNAVAPMVPEGLPPSIA